MVAVSAREGTMPMVRGTNAEGPGGWEARALLGLCDRYYLLTEIIGRSDMLWHGDPGESVPAGNVWLYERCREVEAAPDDRLDLWARDHYKSTIIIWRVIQEILREAENHVGLFTLSRRSATPT